MRGEIERRDKHEGDESRSEETAQNYASKRGLHFGTRTKANREWQESEHGREGGHQNWPQAATARALHGFDGSEILSVAQQVNIIHELDRIIHHDTDEHDYEFKKKHALRFLEEGSKIKAFVFFKGRSILFKDKGEILLLKLATEVEEVGMVEQMPRLEGKRMIMMLAPKKKK